MKCVLSSSTEVRHVLLSLLRGVGMSSVWCRHGDSSSISTKEKSHDISLSVLRMSPLKLEKGYCRRLLKQVERSLIKLNDFIGNIQIFAVLSLNFGQLSIGLGIGYSSILIPQLKEEEEEELVLDAGQEAWVVSLVALGQILGSVLGSVVSAGLGRKGGVLLSTVPSVTGWTVTAISQNVAMLYIARSVSVLYSLSLLSVKYEGTPKISLIICNNWLDQDPGGSWDGNVWNCSSGLRL